VLGSAAGACAAVFVLRPSGSLISGRSRNPRAFDFHGTCRNVVSTSSFESHAYEFIHAALQVVAVIKQYGRHLVLMCVDGGQVVTVQAIGTAEQHAICPQAQSECFDARVLLLGRPQPPCDHVRARIQGRAFGRNKAGVHGVLRPRMVARKANGPLWFNNIDATVTAPDARDRVIHQAGSNECRGVRAHQSVVWTNGNVVIGCPGGVDHCCLDIFETRSFISKYRFQPGEKNIGRETTCLFAVPPGTDSVGDDEKAVAKAGLTMDDMGVSEVSEAFASVVLQAAKGLHLGERMGDVNPATNEGKLLIEVEENDVVKGFNITGPGPISVDEVRKQTSAYFSASGAGKEDDKSKALAAFRDAVKQAASLFWDVYGEQIGEDAKPKTLDPEQIDNLTPELRTPGPPGLDQALGDARKQAKAYSDASKPGAEEDKNKALAAFRDATLFKVCYAFGLRRRELAMLDVADFTANPAAPALGGLGICPVRYGKAMRGSPPRRRAVAAVMPWAVEALAQYLGEVRPRYGAAAHPALWLTERGGRISARQVDDRFALWRTAAGLPAELSVHSLRHSYVSHLIEDGVDPLFVQQQVGHSWCLDHRSLHDRRGGCEEPDAGRGAGPRV